MATTNLNAPYGFRFVKMDGGGPVPEILTVKTSSAAVTKGDLVYINPLTGRAKLLAAPTITIAPFGVAEETLAAVAGTDARDLLITPLSPSAVFRAQCGITSVNVTLAVFMGRRLRVGAFTTGAQYISGAAIATNGVASYAVLCKGVGFYEAQGNVAGTCAQILVKFVRSQYCGSTAPQ